MQKLFRIKGEAPLSVSARNHANLLRCSSVPPLQRLCQEVVLRASREKRAMHVACTCRRAFRPCALDYTIIYSNYTAKREKERNPLFTFESGA